MTFAGRDVLFSYRSVLVQVFGAQGSLLGSFVVAVCKCAVMVVGYMSTLYACVVQSCAVPCVCICTVHDSPLGDHVSLGLVR